VVHTNTTAVTNVAFAPAQVTVNISFDNEMFKANIKQMVLELAPQIVAGGMHKAGN